MVFSAALEGQACVGGTFFKSISAGCQTDTEIQVLFSVHLQFRLIAPSELTLTNICY